jgi:acyl-CoA dehydrogenase
MTEPDVAWSDATNIATRIERNGDHYVINGRKWWTSGAMSPRCELLIVMGVTDPDAERHRRQSMILIPKDTPGVRVERSTSLFGYDDGPHGGHAEIAYEDVRVPALNLLGEEGEGFRLAQERLGPGASTTPCARSGWRSGARDDVPAHRVAIHVRAPDHRARRVQRWISEARVKIEQVRLLVLKTAWLMDTVGNRGARVEVSAIKVAARRGDVGDRPGHPGSRRRRGVAGPSPRRALRGGAHPADRRRARRGAPHGDRAPGEPALP